MATLMQHWPTRLAPTALGLLALDGPHLGRKQVLHAEIPQMSQQLAQK